MPIISLTISGSYWKFLVTINIFMVAITMFTLLDLVSRGVMADIYHRGYKTVKYHQLLNVTCIAHDAKYTCDCGHINQIMLLPRLLGSAYHVDISNCKALTINANALGDIQGLRKITFNNINNLILNKYALAFPIHASNTPLVLRFEKVNIEIIDSHAINGLIEEITFVDGHINTINPFAVTILKDHALLLKMDNISINCIESQAFKKFVVEQIDVRNCKFISSVPSKAFYEVEVLDTLNIIGVQFQDIHSRAFSFKMISKLTLIQNNFKSVDAEWLEAFIKEAVSIRENNFGQTSQIAFKAIMLHRDYVSNEKMELRFSNNIVSFRNQIRPLDFQDMFHLNIKRLYYDNEFSCHDVDVTQQPPQPKSVFFQQHKDQLYFRFNSNADQSNDFILLSQFIATECRESTYWLYIVAPSIGLLLLLIIIIISTIVLFKQKTKRQQLKIEIIKPEQRTYKETQIIYQIENAGLLKTDL
ncbi:uncharacterized protein ACN427_012054 isoform 1-T12 [Glossina fuscipes fuscipes]